jgi:hypothetical protein
LQFDSGRVFTEVFLRVACLQHLAISQWQLPQGGASILNLQFGSIRLYTEVFLS